MNAENGLTCSSINLRSEPDLKSGVIEALDPQENVQILGEQGDMLKVVTTKWKPPLTGYILKSAIFESKAAPEVFPRISPGKGMEISSVPASLPLSTFLKWLDSSDESPWLPVDYLRSIQLSHQPSVGNLIRKAISDRRSDWEAWVAEIRSQGREASATLDEWLVVLARGRAMWSFRPERIFTEPSQSAAAPGWVSVKDVLRWTGHVRINGQETKYKTWYEVELTKLDQTFKGWYKASLLYEFILPTPDTDLSVPENKDRVFDLSRPALRLPADPEIEEARKAGRTGAQYINVKEATGWNKVNHNLCGEFCVAALGGSDIVPFLGQWLGSYDNARAILEKDEGTSIVDLQAMLDVFGKKNEFFRAEASVMPITPGYIRKMLDSSRMAIIGTGVTYDGVLKWGSRIRHWVVIEDIIMVGNSGWVRVYNPFPNKEEVYPFDVVFDPNSRSAIGLWVEPTHPQLKQSLDDSHSNSIALHAGPFAFAPGKL